MKKKKYTYETLIKELPKKYQTDIYKYIVVGRKMALDGAGIKEGHITKKELAEYDIGDIEERYPVDSLLEEFNR